MVTLVSHPRITQDDIVTYERDGVVHLKSVLNVNEIKTLRQSVEKQMLKKGCSLSCYDLEDLQRKAFSDDSMNIDLGNAERFDIELLKFIVDTDPDAKPLRDKLVGEREGEGEFFYDAAGWRHFHGIEDVACSSNLPEIATKLMKTEYTNFWEDTTFVKAPRTSQRTAFHQDWGYFQIEGEKCCIAWIPLDSVDEENGRMEYIRGSHRWGKVYAPNILFAQSTTPLSPYDKLPDIEGNREDYDIVGFNCEPGDVIIHHVKTIHGAGGNLSNDRIRRAVAIRYTGDDVRYFDKPGAVEQQYLTGELKNGDRLNSADYPLVWPQSV